MDILVRLVTVVAVLTAAPLSAQINASGVFKTGDQLYAACTSSDQGELNKCDWFVMAAHDMTTYFQDVGDTRKEYCPPEAVQADALRAVVVQYLREKPASQKYSAVSNIQNAFTARYPCAS